MSKDAAYSDEEIEHRMNAAVRRALSTPPQPHAAKPRAGKPPGLVKARASRKLANGGKSAPSA